MQHATHLRRRARSRGELVESMQTSSVVAAPLLCCAKATVLVKSKIQTMKNKEMLIAYSYDMFFNFFRICIKEAVAVKVSHMRFDFDQAHGLEVPDHFHVSVLQHYTTNT